MNSTCLDDHFYGTYFPSKASLTHHDHEAVPEDWTYEASFLSTSSCRNINMSFLSHKRGSLPAIPIKDTRILQERSAAPATKMLDFCDLMEPSATVLQFRFQD